MKRLILILALAACDPPPAAPVTLEEGPPGPAVEDPRFRVKRTGWFYDSAAYGGTRSIFIVTDSTTGKEFVGISGVGISEVGSHTEGAHPHQQTVTDER